jgi:hypothetical protein
MSTFVNISGARPRPVFGPLARHPVAAMRSRCPIATRHAEGHELRPRRLSALAARTGDLGGPFAFCSHIALGAIALSDALPVAMQIADVLEAARSMPL